MASTRDAEDFEIRLRLKDAAGALDLLYHSARVDPHLRVAVQMVTEERGRLAELMAEAATEAVRMARLHLAEHEGSIDPPDAICVFCGDVYPCAIAADALAVIERWST